MKRFELTILFITAWLALFPGSAPGQAEDGRTIGLEGRIVPLTEGWTYRWDDPFNGPEGSFHSIGGEIPGKAQWEPYDLKRYLHPKPGHLLWLKKTLSEASLSSAALFLPQYSCFRAFEVYLDGARIYKSGELSPSFTNRHLYIKWHIVPLPSDYFGKTLSFRFFSDHPNVAGIASAIYLGEVSTILGSMVLRDVDITAFGLLMIIAGLFAGSLVIAYYRLRSLALLCFSIMAVSAGIYTLSESNMTSLMLDHPVLQSYLHYVTFFLFAGAGLAFLGETVGGSGKRFCWVLCFFEIGYLVAAMLLDLLDILSWDTAFNAGMMLLGVNIAAAEVLLLRTAIAGSLEARLLCFGYGILGLSAAWDILAGLQVISPQRVVFPWGLAVLLICLGTVLALRHRTERKEVEEAIRRSEERFRSLFENAPISILEVDFMKERPTVICANKPTIELFGLEAEELSRLPLDRLFSSQAMLSLCRAMESLGSATHATMESTCLRGSRVEFPARVGASLMEMFGLSRVVLTVEDITEEKERRSEEEAIAEERRRMAREIHDGLAQDLAVMNMKASVWHRLVDGRPEQMHAEIRLFQQLLKKNIVEVRRCIYALRPVDLEELGFFEAARRFMKDFGEQNQIEASFELTGAESDLPYRLEPVLFRILQEALNNARKHSKAKSVRAHVQIGAGASVELDIQDDGKGFDISQLEVALRNGHLGVKQMRERVERQGGSFYIQSDMDKGTRVRVTLPLTG